MSRRKKRPGNESQHDDNSIAHQSPQQTLRGLALAYGITVFLSAFLLFQVQPLISKAVLPWFGGPPGVWTTCMLVFQTLLFCGYAYAHLTTTWLKPRAQTIVHITILVLAALALPILPGAHWKP